MTQAKMNRFLCGDHLWVSGIPGFLIIGFKVIEQVWEGKPNRSGWDAIKETRVLDRFANFEDAKALEERMHNLNRPNRSYFIEPIQAKGPSEEALRLLHAFPACIGD